MSPKLKDLLEGIRVLDLTHVFFGPFTTLLLAEMGADVIKIEPPWGELMRLNPPLINGASPICLFFNQSKKCITLNLKSSKGVEIFKRLVKISDVVVENFRPGTIDRMGLSYDVLKDVNPKIIFTSLSGFGQTGPYSPRPSFNAIAQAISGYMRLTGDQVSPEFPPILVPESDFTTIFVILLENIV